MRIKINKTGKFPFFSLLVGSKNPCFFPTRREQNPFFFPTRREQNPFFFPTRRKQIPFFFPTGREQNPFFFPTRRKQIPFFFPTRRQKNPFHLPTLILRSLTGRFPLISNPLLVGILLPTKQNRFPTRSEKVFLLLFALSLLVGFLCPA
jgi:hypothetical protein